MLNGLMKSQMISSNQAQCDREGGDFQRRSGTENYDSDFERRHFLHEPGLPFEVDKHTSL
jgi:hypothetical protein